MDKELEVNGKKFKVRELFAVELDGIDWTDKANALKKQVILSTELTEEDYSKLTVKERMKIVQTINEVNGFADFQEPTKE